MEHRIALVRPQHIALAAPRSRLDPLLKLVAIGTLATAKPSWPEVMLSALAA